MRSFIPERQAAAQDSEMSQLIRTRVAIDRSQGEGFNKGLEDVKKGLLPINQRGGHFSPPYDLGDARFTTPGYIEYPGAGWGLVYSNQGSTPGGVLDIDFDGGGVATLLEPGAVLRGYFNGFRIRRNAASMTAGSALLRVLVEPDVHYLELPKGVGAGVLGNPSGLGVGPAGAVTQAQASTANIPSLATDGLSLVGATSVRAQVIAPVGQTLTAATGELVWWQYDTVTGVWGETDLVDSYGPASTSGTVRRIWFPLDKQVWVPEGRIYPEARSMAASGAGALVVRLFTWGG